MRDRFAVRGACLVLLSGLIPAAARGVAEEGVNLKELKRIAVADEEWRDLEPAAKNLAKTFKDTWGLDLEVVKGAPKDDAPAILLGRSLAAASGTIAEKDLDAVKHDGYVVRGGGNRIAVAGYRPLGTKYGTFAMLRQIGLRIYPNHNGPGSATAYTPAKDDRVAPFNISSRPFFEWRSVASHLDREGAFGTTVEDTGDTRSAANPEILGAKRKPGYSKFPAKAIGDDWVDSQHSAGYLVPRDLYYETHPEYFAMHGGKRIAPNQYMRMCICLTNPDVRRISVERALEWIGLQKDRRFFWIADADSTMCHCPECIRTDYRWGCAGDRLLTWVNLVAAPIVAQHPEKIVLTMGYQETVKTPSRVKPDPNVRVMYCPWYWNARGGPGQSLADPGNVIAMEEFVAWNLWCPGQVGLYAYPGELLWLRGLVDDVKMCAKYGMRSFHGCGRAILFGELYQYVMARLLWDPFLDTGRIEEEFCRAFYGPAAEPMLRFLALHHATVERNAGLFSDAEYAVKGPEFLREAAKLAEADPGALFRTQGSILLWFDHALPAACPRADKPLTKEKYEQFRDNLAYFDRTNASYRAACTKLKLGWVGKQREKAFAQVLASCGVKPDTSKPPDQPGEAKPKDDDPEKDADLMQRTFAYLDELAKKAPPPGAAEAEEAKAIEVKFDTEEAVKRLDLDATQADLIAPPALASVRGADGEELRGGKVVLPMSRLPAIELPNHPEGIHRAHAGRFLMTVALPEPLDMTGRRFLEFRLHASRDLPITVYMDFGGCNGQRADFSVHAGEQVLRVDVRNLNRVDPAKWDKKINGIKMDFWPQDVSYPYPAVQDVEVVLAGVAARSRVQSPAELPHQGKAIWLTQRRGNIPHSFVPMDAKLLKRTKQVHPTNTERGVYWEGERFRSFTSHRALSPVLAIVAGAKATPAEKDAAKAIQEQLARIFGVTLPIDPPGLDAGPGCGNAVVIGREACLAAGLVTEAELARAGAEGFVLRAHQGRIAIAGSGGAGAAFGAARYLEDHGAVFAAPGKTEKTPDLKAGYLHELFVLDWPYFPKRPVPGGWRLRSQGAAKAWENVAAPQAADVEAAEKLAEAIKDSARKGADVPDEVLKSAASPLAAYVAAKLLWDPFADTSRLIGEFQEAVRR